MSWAKEHKGWVLGALGGVVVVCGGLVAVAILQSGTTGAPVGPAPDPHVIDTETGERPEIEFPAASRSANPEVNAFVERFLDACVGGRYRSYCKMVSSRLDPKPIGEFEQAYKMVRKVRITGLEPVGEPDEGPAQRYVLTATVQLVPRARRPNKEIRIAIFREQGKWVISDAADPDDDRLPGGSIVPSQ